MSQRRRKKPASIDEFLHQGRDDMFPKMKASAMSVAIIDSNPDPKLCLEIGAAIMLDKPIIAVVLPGTTVPVNLKRVASAIIEGHPSKTVTSERLKQAINALSENDIRFKAMMGRIQ